MDETVVHALNGYALHHDAVEDGFAGYATAAEYVFVAGLVVLFLLGGRGGWQRRAALAAGASAAVALVVAKVVAQLVDRARLFVADPSHVHLFVKHAADPGFPSEHATAAFAIGTALVLRSRP